MSFFKDISDSSQESKGFIGFGLNSGYISKMVAEQGKYGFQIAVEFASDKGTVRNWIGFPFVADANKQQVTDRASQEYQEGLKKVANKMLGTILHYLKALSVVEAVVKQAIDRVPYNEAGVFSEYVEEVCKSMLTTLPADYANKPVDVFMQYGKLKSGNTRNFVELPTTMLGGHFIHPTVPGVFTEVQDAEGMHYVTKEGVKHPLTKTKYFMDGKFAKEINQEGKNSKKVDMTVKKTASINADIFGL